MALFLSTYTNKVDKKGRISVPALFRTNLESDDFSGVVLYRSYKHQAIEGCSLSRMAQLSGALDDMDQFSDEQDDLAATIFADARQLNIDGDGRITLPDDLASFANITDQACFVGRGATFQLWAPSLFTEYQDAARTRAAAKNMTLRIPKP